MPSCHPRQLKALRSFPVPSRSLEAGRARLLAVMAASPLLFDARPRRLFFLNWKPAALLVALGAFALVGSGTVLAAQTALPGQGLYSVKLASEKVREGFAIFPTRKFIVQAAHAARRLKESEQLIARSGSVDEERIQDIRSALRAYEVQVFQLNAAALRWPVGSSRQSGEHRMVQAAEQLLDRHAALIASTTAMQPALAEAVLEPVDATLQLQQDVFEAVAVPNKASSESEELSRRHQQREGQIQEQLRSLQFELQASKSLESLTSS